MNTEAEGRGVSDEEAARLALGGLPMTPVRGHLCTDDCPVGYHRHPEAGRSLPWATVGQRRCVARVEPNPSGMWGRCDLRRGHDGDHALERGMDTPRWSTAWTDVIAPARVQS